MGEIPLRPDRGAMSAMVRRAYARAGAALLLSQRAGTTPEKFAAATWHDRDVGPLLTKAAVPPLDTTSIPGSVVRTEVLASLSPDAASAKLLAKGHQFSLAGVSTIRLATVPPAGRPSSVFVAEGAPFPINMATTADLILGPTRKLMFGFCVTRELEDAAPESASQIIGEAFSLRIKQDLDAILFSSTAATPISPPGLLAGLSSLTPSGTKGAGGIADDLALLSQSISDAGVSVEGLIFVTSATCGMKIKTLAGPLFDNTVLTSAEIPAGRIIAIAPSGLSVGYTGSIDIERSISPAMHLEQTTPLPIIGATGTLAVPVTSTFQASLIAMRLRCKCAWVAHPGSIAFMDGVAW